MKTARTKCFLCHLPVLCEEDAEGTWKALWCIMQTWLSRILSFWKLWVFLAPFLHLYQSSPTRFTFTLGKILSFSPKDFGAVKPEATCFDVFSLIPTLPGFANKACLLEERRKGRADKPASRKTRGPPPGNRNPSWTWPGIYLTTYC